MAWYFLSYELSDQISGYGGGEQIKIKQARSMCCGDTSNNTEFWMPTHFGTHIDYPFHFSTDGKNGSSYQASDFVFNKVQILDLDLRERSEKLIGPDDIQMQADDELEVLIIHTHYSKKRYQQDYWENGPGFQPETAAKLKEKFKSLKLIGFDSISLTNFQNRPLGRVAHKSFLIDHDLIILEDMDLSPIDSIGKIDRMIVAPLRMINADGAPVTVMVETNK